MILDIENLLKKKSKLVDKEIIKLFPKKLTASWLKYALGKPEFTYDVKTCSTAVANPIWDLLGRGGKRWRPSLTLLALEAVGGEVKKFKEFAVMPELIHNGTLIIDDIEDDSELRRGKPCTHKLFGIDLAVNDGNAMYYLPLTLLYKNKKKLSDKTKSKIYDLYAEEMLRLSFGQAMDIYWHNGNKDSISEKEYLQMCSYKTGTLARFSAKLGAILGNASDKQVEALGSFAGTIGVGFQIQDDILNVTVQGDWGKVLGDDIHEGKHTLMVIHALSKSSLKDKKALLKILKSHTSNKAKINQVINLFKKYNSIEYANKKAKSLVKIAWKKLDEVLPKSQAKTYLKEFADFLIERQI